MKFQDALVKTVVSGFLGLFPLSIFAEVPSAPTGIYTTSWMGNTFMNVNGEQEECVPEVAQDVTVSPNGKVFTAGYHERAGGGASFDAATGAFAGRYSGFNTGFGEPSNAVAADANYVYFGTKDGVKRYPHGGGNNHTTFLASKEIIGVALKDGLLYLSDYTDNRIRIYNAATFTEVTSWAVSKPTRLAVDNDNRIWVIQEAANSVQPTNEGPMWFGGNILSFSNTGVPGPVITNFEKPMALEVNRATNQLYVGGLNQHSQLWIYGNLATTPTQVGTFGLLNGIFSGTAGEFNNTAKLHWIRGIDFDSAGNVYVACAYGTFWGQCVEKFSSAGALQWRVFCATSLDGGGIDPANEEDIYTKFHHYKMNWNATTPGSEWSLKGFTVNRFKYPNDPRVDHLTDVGNRSLGYGAVRIGGKRFMIRSEQGGYHFEMYRFDPANDGEVAIPSVVMPSGFQTKIKRDTNGNGTFEPSETDEMAPLGWTQFWDITPTGNLYTTLIHDAKILSYPLQGLDAVGNPIYTHASRFVVTVPSSFTSTHRVRQTTYDESADRMMILGSPLSVTNDDGEINRIACFTNWSQPTRQLLWSVNIPLNDSQYTTGLGYGGGRVACLRHAGDYIFLAYGFGHVRILSKATGALVGTLTQRVNGWQGTAGQIDAAYGMTAYRRANGEYIILIENASWGNITMYRWEPTAVPPPMIFDGSFETPTTTNYTPGATGGPWYFTNDCGVQRNGSAYGAPSAPQGVQTAFIQGKDGNNGSMNLPHAFAAGFYKITFQTARRTGYGGTQSFDLFFDNTKIGTYAPTNSSFALVSSATFQATAGMHNIHFFGTSTSGDNTAFIDDVKIEPVPPQLVDFRSTHSLNANGSQDTATPAGDGIANLLKFAFNMIGGGAGQSIDLTTPNATVMASNGSAGLPLVDTDSTGKLRITYVRRKAASNSGITYAVEFSDTLANDSWAVNAPEATVVTSIDSTFERVVLTDNASPTKRFVRVKITAP